MARQYFADYTALAASTSDICIGDAELSIKAPPSNAMHHALCRSFRALPVCLAALSSCHETDASRTEPAPVIAAAGAIVPVVADERGFTPAAVQTDRGNKLTLRFTRTSDATCADKVVFPEAGISKDLPLKQPVDIEVPTAQARTLAFQCGMGMFKSAVVIK